MASQEEGIKLFGKTIAVPAEDHDDGGSDGDGDSPSLDKKPDKIIPCPRCKSLETKFCYFNNYNVNQPRHFCKGCQRYWTAGGALRNVPVGAGRRKNKPPGARISPPAGGVHHPFQAVVEEWQLAAAAGGFRDVFPIKRRRCGSGGQPCVN
ncbi:unnamed protein product [Linum tenue]|uniref:Dof-type domain-containing protein n=1 Tax=Linum tenue TaxID=586396 RepID=A0AAV0MER5_9ROSI|nr:unnamed protein product [Linum tenue]